MKKFSLTSISISIVMLLAYSCTTIRVLNVNKEADFSLSDYETYDFYKINIDTTAFPEYNKRFIWVEEELMKQLGNNGLERSVTNPDLFINIGIMMETKQQTRQTDFSDAVFMYQRNYKWESEEIVLGEYHEGTFAIDFVKAEDNSLQCMVVGDAVIVKKEREAKKNIEVGLKKMFRKINKD